MNEPPGRLGPIIEDVRKRLAKRLEQRSLAELLRQVEPVPARRQAFVAALRGKGLAIIGEHKRRSPTRGPLSRRTLHETLKAYTAAGIHAISVLTEKDHFDGTLQDLSHASRTGLPCLRKDFILDRYMLIEAALHGASAVLLLACLHDATDLTRLTQEAHEAGLAVLLEIHQEDELDRALTAGPDAIGVNARDLRSFNVNLDRTCDLLPRIPDLYLRVAESGIHNSADAHRVRDAGADAILVGESLMQCDDPTTLVRQLCHHTGGER